MAEKYTLLMHESAMHWADGCPVMLASHAIARNNVTGSIFAQLKFQSFAERCIKAVSVSVAGYDTYGQPCTDTLKYTYTDLVISSRDFFGSQTALPLSPNTSRYTVTVDNVFFVDETVWLNESNTPMQPLELPEQKSIATLGASASLYLQELGQLQPRYPHQSLPAAGNCVKLCGCGALMLLQETICPCCGIQYSELETLVQLDLLQKQRDELARREEELRLAEERARAEEQQLAEKQLLAEVAQHTDLEPQQKTEQKSAQLNNQQAVGIKAKKKGSKKGVKRLLVVLALLLVAAAAAGLLIWRSNIPAIQYMKASALFERGEYAAAAEAYAALVPHAYKDAYTQLQECRYQEGIKLLEADDFANAEEKFLLIENYNNYKETKGYLTYCSFMSALQDGEDEQAYTLYLNNRDDETFTNLAGEVWIDTWLTQMYGGWGGDVNTSDAYFAALNYYIEFSENDLRLTVTEWARGSSTPKQKEGKLYGITCLAYDSNSIKISCKATGIDVLYLTYYYDDNYFEVTSWDSRKWGKLYRVRN